MKKSKKRTAGQKISAASAAARGQSVNRRDLLTKLGISAAGCAAAGGAGWWFVSSVQAVAAEQDLSRLGSGVPTIVQIHDPQCSMCTELQRETRKALRCFDKDEILYLVASIRTEQGAQFAAARGLPHVTLVLLDEEGKARNVLQGVRGRDELKGHFQSLIAQS